MPISNAQRKFNEMGEGYVPCEVSDRWLQFHEDSAYVGNSEFISVDVMTLDSEEQPKKLCHIFISRENILRALKYVKPKE